MKFSAENYARKYPLSHTRVEISSRLGKFSSCLVICGQQPVASSLDAQRLRMMNAQPLGNQFESQDLKLWNSITISITTNFNHKKFPSLH